MSETFFTAEQVGKRFGGKWVLGPLDFALSAGECLAVVGPSGSGKSTLLRLAAGLLPLDSGRFTCLGERWDTLPAWRRRVAWAPPQGSFFPQWTVRRNLEFRLREAARERIRAGWRSAASGLAADLLPFGRPSPRIAARARKVLSAWGLEAWAERRPHELSAGERQRATLAAVSSFRRRLVLLDEPLGHVDVVDRPAWARAWRAWQRRRRQTTLYVTHDPAEAALVADRVLLLREGRLEQLAPFAELSRSPASPWAAEWAARPNPNLLSARRTETAHGPRWEVGGIVQESLPPPREGERLAQLRFAPEAVFVGSAPAADADGDTSGPEAVPPSGPRREPKDPGGGMSVCGIVSDAWAGGGRGLLLPTEEFVRAAADSPSFPIGTAAGVWIPSAALHWSVRAD